jgi:hypothetical protein
MAQFRPFGYRFDFYDLARTSTLTNSGAHLFRNGIQNNFSFDLNHSTTGIDKQITRFSVDHHLRLVIVAAFLHLLR